MTPSDRALAKAIRHLQEGAAAIGEAVRSRKMLKEFDMVKRDNTQITVLDLYRAVNEAVSAYRGEVATNLAQAAKYLYAAHQASVAQANAKAAPRPQAAPTQAAPTQESRTIRRR